MTTLFTHLQGPWGAALVWFAGAWAVTLFIRKVSKDADDEFDPDKRQELADRLSQLRREGMNTSWVPDFTFVFDRFFGTRHLSWRCFYRSALISIVAFVVAYNILTTTLLPNHNLEVFEITGLLLLCAFAAIVNSPIDYLSLLETRLVLKVTRVWLPARIAFDAILTYLLSVGWLIAALAFIARFLLDHPGSIGPSQIAYALSTAAGLPANPEAWSSGVSVLVLSALATSFTTSIWLWLHGLAQLTIRALGSVQWLMTWLNVKEKPLRAVGTMINVYVILFSVLLFPLFWMIK